MFDYRFYWVFLLIFTLPRLTLIRRPAISLTTKNRPLENLKTTVLNNKILNKSYLFCNSFKSGANSKTENIFFYLYKKTYATIPRFKNYLKKWPKVVMQYKFGGSDETFTST